MQRSENGALRSLDYQDIYFQRTCGREESHYVFIEKNGLPERFSALGRNSVFTVGELGFGSGLNFLQTAKAFCAAPHGTRLHFISIEKHPIAYGDLQVIYNDWPEFSFLSKDVLAQYPPIIEGFHHLHLADGRITLSLLMGDVADVLPQMTGKADAWFLDGFSSDKNPAMWDEKLYSLIAARTKAGGTLSTFSSAGHVRKGLMEAGFTVEKVKGYGVKRDMVVANLAGATAGTVAVANREAMRRVVVPNNNISIIGAGIAGCSAAYAFARRGYNVTVYDRHANCASEASGNPVGIIYPKLTVDTSPMGEYYKHAFCYTRNLLEFLQLPSWKPCGVLRLDLNDDDKARSQKLIDKQQPPSELVEFLPQTAFDKSALSHAIAGYLDPREFCAKLLDHLNIKCVFGHDVADWKSLDADIVVIAQANASKQYLETADLPLQPLRGQISFLKPVAGSEKLSKVICHKGYISPVMDGVHVAGATFHKEEVGSPDVRPQDHAENIAALSKHLPGLGLTMANVQGGRTSWRATTPDKLPVAGKITDGLYVLTGLGAHGLTGAPLMGELIAAQIAGDPLPVPENLVKYFLPERFKR